MTTTIWRQIFHTKGKKWSKFTQVMFIFNIPNIRQANLEISQWKQPRAVSIGDFQELHHCWRCESIGHLTAVCAQEIATIRQSCRSQSRSLQPRQWRSDSLCYRRKQLELLCNNHRTAATLDNESRWMHACVPSKHQRIQERKSTGKLCDSINWERSSCRCSTIGSPEFHYWSCSWCRHIPEDQWTFIFMFCDLRGHSRHCCNSNDPQIPAEIGSETWWNCKNSSTPPEKWFVHVKPQISRLIINFLMYLIDETISNRLKFKMRKKNQTINNNTYCWRIISWERK